MNVAIHVPGVGSYPEAVIVPTPESIMLFGVRIPSLIDERVSENAPADHKAPAGSAPAGLTAMGDAMVVVEKRGTETKSPAVATTNVDPMPP